MTRREAASEIWRYAKEQLIVAAVLAVYAGWTWCTDQFPDKVTIGPIAFLFDVAPWWFIAILALLFALWATFEWGVHEVGELRRQAGEKPSPHLVFQRERPRFATIEGIFWTDAATDKAYMDARPAYCLGAEYRNVPSSSPPSCALDKPHVAITYYRELATSSQSFALVRDGRIAEAPQQYDPRNRGRGIRSSTEVALPEVRVGQYVTIDLLVRLDGQTHARTWSNDGGGGFGGTEFPPGEYLAVVEVNGENMPQPLIDRFAIVVPHDPDAKPTATRISPQC